MKITLVTEGQPSIIIGQEKLRFLFDDIRPEGDGIFPYLYMLNR